MLVFVVPPAPASDDRTDGDIARRIASGGPGAADAERELCARFAPRKRVYGRRHLGDAQSAEDLVQLVLVRVLEALRTGRVERPDSLAGFVLGTSRNVALDVRRSERRQRSIAIESQRLHHDPDPSSSSARDVVKLLGCIRKLPDRDRQIIRMTFMEDRDTAEVADRLGLTDGNVRVVRHRALAKLLVCLEQGGST